MFYKETAFQETAIGRIPKDWTVKYVNELFQVETGTTPSTTKKVDYWEKGTVNWLTPADMSKSDGAIYISSGERRITEKAVKDCNLTVMPKGSLILSTRAPVGYVAVLSEESAFNQGCKGLIPREYEDVCPEFYYYYLMSKKQILNNLSSGSTFKELSKEMLEKVRVVFLKPREQKGIVEVLSCVDLAIQKTDEVIAKTQRLKKGLMQKLLTEGIGHKEFKDTEIGKIPKEWHFRSLAEFSMTRDSPIQTGPFGAQLHAHDYVDEGVPLILIKNVLEGQIVEEDMPKISEAKASELSRYRLKEGDIVFSRVGSVGRGAVIKKHQEGWLVSGQMLRVRLENPSVDNDFLSYAIMSSWFQRALESRTVGATRKSINTEILSNLPMVAPSSDEQHKIVQILSASDIKLELERRQVSRLERIKQGFMDLLLTGKVRVKVD